MAFTAVLVAITEVKSISPELMQFVTFGARLKGFEPEPSEKVALLQVKGTSSYFPVFLDRGITLDEIIEEATQQDVELPRSLRNLLATHLDTQKE